MTRTPKRRRTRSRRRPSRPCAYASAAADVSPTRTAQTRRCLRRLAAAVVAWKRYSSRNERHESEQRLWRRRPLWPWQRPRKRRGARHRSRCRYSTSWCRTTWRSCWTTTRGWSCCCSTSNDRLRFADSAVALVVAASVAAAAAVAPPPSCSSAATASTSSWAVRPCCCCCCCCWRHHHWQPLCCCWCLWCWCQGWSPRTRCTGSGSSG